MSIEKKNSEHYDDLTPYQAIRNIESEERAKRLIFVLKYIIKHSDFELLNRIHIQDKVTGKQYK